MPDVVNVRKLCHLFNEMIFESTFYIPNYIWSEMELFLSISWIFFRNISKFGLATPAELLHRPLILLILTYKIRLYSGK